ncbi:hypothetical protein BE61_58740 [Bradyrhizobium elkanii USDA 61]|nr:hypothetical protein BE61_58740 [Bradyrhizobium elkanii USDA 61]
MAADMDMAVAMATTAVTSVRVAGGPRVVFAFAGGNNRPVDTSDIEDMKSGASVPTHLICFWGVVHLPGLAQLRHARKSPGRRRGSSHGRERFRNRDARTSRRPDHSMHLLRA